MVKDPTSFVSTARGVATRLIDATKFMVTPSMARNSKEEEPSLIELLIMPGENMRDQVNVLPTHHQLCCLG